MTRRITTIAAALGLFAVLVLVDTVAPASGQDASPARLLAAPCSAEVPTLFEVPLGGGAATEIGPIVGAEVDCPTGMVYLDGVLYALDYGTGELYTIPLTAGAVTPLGDPGIDGPCGLEYNAADGEFWAVAYDDESFWSLPTDGGPATFISDLGFAACGLAYDPGTGLLYTLDFDNGLLYSIAPDTGTPTLIGSIGVDDPCALVRDSDQGRLLGALENDPTSVYEIGTDASTTDLGVTGLADICALGYIPEVLPVTTTTTTTSSSAPAVAPVPTASPAATVARTPAFTG